MLTIEALKEYGADVDTGLARCMGMKDFYIRMVNLELGDKNFSALEEAVKQQDTKAAFEAVHALKGALGNLSLTPLLKPIYEMTDLLRGAQAMPDITELSLRLMEELDRLKKLAQ